jgi:nucleotidyltransferase substrate binding protein (TIGR01987 family)
MSLMRRLQTEHLKRCIQTLDSSVARLREARRDSVDYEIYRNAVVKGFELTLETAGSLLRKALKAYLSNPRKVDELTYKDAFREGAKHGLVSPSAVQRWFEYRENRNLTAHDYGAALADETVELLPEFISDARALETKLTEKLGDGAA